MHICITSLNMPSLSVFWSLEMKRKNKEKGPRELDDLFLSQKEILMIY